MEQLVMKFGKGVQSRHPSEFFCQFRDSLTGRCILLGLWKKVYTLAVKCVCPSVYTLFGRNTHLHYCHTKSTLSAQDRMLLCCQLYVYVHKTTGE